MSHQSYTYPYPRPSLTVDCVLFCWVNSEVEILLIQRASDPFKNSWALPGGFVDEDESLENAALRELEEETGIGKIELTQLITMGDPERDPRGRVVSVAFYGWVRKIEMKISAGDDASDAKWFPISSLPELAFDHQEIIEIAMRRIRNTAEYFPIGRGILPASFTMNQYHQFYQSLLGEKIQFSSFSKKIMTLSLVQPASENSILENTESFYQFNDLAYEQFLNTGFTTKISGEV